MNWVRFSPFQAVSKYVSRLGAADWSGERQMRLYHFKSAFNSNFKGLVLVGGGACFTQMYWLHSTTTSQKWCHVTYYRKADKVFDGLEVIYL